MLGERLISLRKAKKWTQTDLAERCGVSRNSIVNWETNRREPKMGDIQKLADVLEVSPNDLIGDDRVIQHNQADIDITETMEKTDNDSLIYWGAMLDKVYKIANCGNMQEINAIIPILKTALDMLIGAGEPLAATTHGAGATVSAYNGNHSSYINSTLNLEKATA